MILPYWLKIRKKLRKKRQSQKIGNSPGKKILRDGLTPTDVPTVLEVPEELREHEAMKGVTAKVVETLGESDPPTDSEKDTNQDMVDALVKALGPVCQLFGEGKWLQD